MPHDGLGDVLGLGVAVPDLDGPVAAACDDVPLLEDLLVQQAADLALVGVCYVIESAQLEVLGLGEFLGGGARTFWLKRGLQNTATSPLLSPIDMVWSPAQNLKQVILIFSENLKSLRGCTPEWMLVSGCLYSKRLSLMNSIFESADYKDQGLGDAPTGRAVVGLCRTSSSRFSCWRDTPPTKCWTYSSTLSWSSSLASRLRISPLRLNLSR